MKKENSLEKTKSITLKEQQTSPVLLIIESDDMCLACFKPNNSHNAEDKQNCSKKLVEMGIMRFCGLCGLTKPAQKTHDRCGKCGEKYSFSNE